MIRSYQGKKSFKGDSTPVQDALVVESPLIIKINKEPLTVTMQSPGNEIELAIGLLLTEGIISYHSPFPLHYEISKSDHESTIEFHINPDSFSIVNKRSLMSISACGICGRTEWSVPKDERLIASKIDFNIENALNKMYDHQKAFHASGGLHAAAIFDSNEDMLVTMEDIGRHNAVDKCIGKLHMTNKLNEATFLIVSGRISYEIIAKCFKAKIQNIAAVSAPSSMAVDFAKEWGIHLWGFCREGRHTQYA